MTLTQSQPEQKRKPIILWTCDCQGWAYHNRIKRLNKVLGDQYEFRIWYFGAPMNWEVKQRYLREADVVVCQGVKALRLVDQMPVDLTGDVTLEEALDVRFKKIVARLDSMRIDINGEYFDIFGPAAEAERSDG